MKHLRLITSIVVCIALFFGAFFIEASIDEAVWYYTPTVITSMILTVVAVVWVVSEAIS